MNLQLEGKRALVTGSTAGTGFAIAQVLASEGASVIVNGRTPQRVEDALKKLKASRAEPQGLAADLGTAAGAHEAITRFPEVEILVNNLGIFERNRLNRSPRRIGYISFEVNVLSGVRLSRYYLPLTKRRNWGRIVFTLSQSAVQIPSGMIHYGMTKTAQVAVSRGLAETTVGTDVTVDAVLAGPTASEGVKNFVQQVAANQKTDAATVEKSSSAACGRLPS